MVPNFAALEGAASIRLASVQAPGMGSSKHRVWPLVGDGLDASYPLEAVIAWLPTNDQSALARNDAVARSELVLTTVREFCSVSDPKGLEAPFSFTPRSPRIER